MSNLSILPWLISLAQTRACRASDTSSRSGTHAHPRNRLQPRPAGSDRSISGRTAGGSATCRKCPWHVIRCLAIVPADGGGSRRIEQRRSPGKREVGRCRPPMPMRRRRRRRQAAGDSGARHPHASPRLGRAFSARGHTEREESGVKGRQDPRSRARRRTRRASGAERRRTDGAQRTMIPKISSPVVSTATAVQLRCFEPLRSTRSQDPQATQHSLRVQHHGCELPDQRVCCENAEAATHRSGSPLP